MNPKKEYITLDHGSGGIATHQLISRLFLPEFKNDWLAPLDDSAVFELNGLRVAFTTDSYTVKPIFFPGGDIGSLCIHGTVNDLAVMGARPLYLSAGLIVEEGFPIDDLQTIAASMSAAAAEAGVSIVTGDTKVVSRGQADGVFINTAGLGTIPEGVKVSGALAEPGDDVLVSGPMGDHGTAVLLTREGLVFDSPIRSDSAPLNGLIAAILQVTKNIHVFRDPTRGGLATTLNEIALASRVGIRLAEELIPVRPEVAAACELLGLDPLYVANEGRLIVIAPHSETAAILPAMQQHSYGVGATVIGTVTADHPGRVSMKTTIGGTRLVDMLVGEPLPRIC
ncbi:MAG: hydrogenase expression/formation protein HypE [Deltaproteobacteria bacterium]|nr:hydrogenase expression/formation protein HypE [Deltaproteobacteria bacterium]